MISRSPRVSVAVIISGLAVLTVPFMTHVTHAQNRPAFILQWGPIGTYPLGLAVDALGNVYVADQLGHRVRKFDNDGTFITQWGTHGTGDGQLGNPGDVAIGPNGHVYVTEIQNVRVSEFTDVGVFVRKWGSSGTGPGQFDYPYGIEVDHEGNVYVTDKSISKVHKFSEVGSFLGSFGLLANGSPGGIACDASNNLYIADTYHKAVVVLASDGTFLNAWAALGNHPGYEAIPQFLTVTASGVVCVADFYWVCAYTTTGTFLTQWGGPGMGGGLFQSVALGIGLDRTGNLFVIDAGPTPFGSVLKFGGGVVPTEASSWGSLKARYR